MPIFTTTDRSILIGSSYKVLYTTLSLTEGLHLINGNEVPRFHPEAKVYFLCRNPYLRLESFYRDKLVVSLRNIENLQHCQQIILEAFDLDKIDIQAAKTFLSTMNINHLVSCLPFIYKKDGHLQPQTIFYKELIGLLQKSKIVNQEVELIKIEHQDLLTIFGKKVGIDFSKKKNSTIGKVDFEQKIGRNSKFILHKLYESDFMNFNYSKDIPK